MYRHLQIENYTSDRLTVTGLETVVGNLIQEDGETADIERGLDDVVTSMENLVNRRPKARITVGHVLPWKQFSDNTMKRIAAFWEMKSSLVAKGHLRSIYFLPINQQGCALRADGIHLTEQGAKSYFGWVIEQSTRALEASPSGYATAGSADQDRSDWNELMTSPVNSGPGNTRKRNLSTTGSLEEIGSSKKGRRDQEDRAVMFSEYTFNRRIDQRTMAKLAEDQDHLENKANLHKVIVQGVFIKGLLDIKERSDRVPVMKNAVKSLLETISKDVEDLEPKEPVTAFLVNERSMKSDKRKRPMIEVSFGSAEYAVKLRQSYGRLNSSWKRTGGGGVPERYKGIFLNPALNHRTRVRLAVFKAIAKGYNLVHAKDGWSSWIIDHLPRPMMKTSEKDSDGKERFRMLTYVDAVVLAQAENLVGDQDLIDAHKTAGRSYGRLLENIFILLK